MKVLVTGGAGYIGSHVTKHLLDQGHFVVAYDNLSYGHIEALDSRAIFVGGNTCNQKHLIEVLKKYSIEAVVHLAAFIDVSESVREPEKYQENNVAGTSNVLNAMVQAKVSKIIFSSTAAVYGNPVINPVKETAELKPINPYGRSKVECESMIQEFSRRHGIGFTIFRYFNVAGAWPDGQIGEDHHPETHLIPLVVKAALNSERTVQIYGSQYSTKDGTCVRDYLHVLDLAVAHDLALGKISDGSGDIYNLGSEKGFSVKEVISTCERILGVPVMINVTQPRAGDPASLIACSEKFQKSFSWQKKYPGIEDMIRHTWAWHRQHPNGYRSKVKPQN